MPRAGRATFRDHEGREIRVRPDPGERDPLVEMYVAFGPGDRAQGLPPSGEAAIRRWLTDLEGAEEVVARHGDRAAGHAFLVPDRAGGHELGVFVHPAYRRAGIGARLVEALLELGRARGVRRVWLTVSRSNDAARYLYREAGFRQREGSETERELEMDLALE